MNLLYFSNLFQAFFLAWNRTTFKSSRLKHSILHSIKSCLETILENIESSVFISVKKRFQIADHYPIFNQEWRNSTVTIRAGHFWPNRPKIDFRGTKHIWILKIPLELPLKLNSTSFDTTGETQIYGSCLSD